MIPNWKFAARKPPPPSEPVDETIRRLTATTERLRAALVNMIDTHTFRFPIHGPCPCHACRDGMAVVEGEN